MLRQVELRDKEIVNDLGKVVLAEDSGVQGADLRKRAASRSPGQSPPARRGFGGTR